jgi:two-component system chemotaxis sensor kinase CheA
MQEMVLKSLEKNFRPVAGLSGASILGDGRVALILDVDSLIAMAAGAGGPP